MAKCNGFLAKFGVEIFDLVRYKMAVKSGRIVLLQFYRLFYGLLFVGSCVTASGAGRSVGRAPAWKEAS